MAGRYSGDPRAARQIIADEKKASIMSEFPSQWYEATFDQIDEAAKSRVRSAQKARKLLSSREYDRT